VTAISSAIDETIAQMDRLNEPERERRARDFQALEAIVSNLAAPFDPSLVDEEPELGRGRRPPDGPRSATPSDGGALPFGVALPERTTHGGAFGPAVRRKLIAEAQDRGDW
jgi:hypothetical protein